MNREEALQLVKSLVKNQNLINHMLCVEASMRWYASFFKEDEELWGLAGLLHDADWEAYPLNHPQEIMRRLKELNADPRVFQAINAHGGKDAIEPDSLMDKALFACDELSGFVVAVARMRPDRFSGMEAASIKKKMKDKKFAAGVNRDDIIKGAELLELPLDEHIAHVILAVSPLKHVLF